MPVPVKNSSSPSTSISEVASNFQSLQESEYHKRTLSQTQTKSISPPLSTLNSPSSTSAREQKRSLHTTSHQPSPSSFASEQNSLLHELCIQAIQQGDINKDSADLIKNVLSYDPSSINNLNHKGLTPLMLVCLAPKQPEELLNILLKNSADLLVKHPHSGRNALMIAAQHNHYHTLRNLIFHIILNPAISIQSENIIEATDNQGNTALMLACEKGHLVSVGTILGCYPHLKINSVPSINQPNIRGLTPLMLACTIKEEDNRELIKILLENGADIFQKNPLSGRNAVMIAAQNNHLTLKYLLMHPVLHTRDELSPEQSQALSTVSEDDPDTLKFLLMHLTHSHLTSISIERSIEATDNKGNTALMLACEKGYFLSVAVILARCPRINIDHVNLQGHNALTISVLHQYPNIVQILLAKQKIGINLQEPEFHYTPLMLAILYQNKQIVSHLLSDRSHINSKEQLDVDAEAMDGTTALILACKYDLPQIASLLLSYGANPNKADRHGNSPLMIATHAESLNTLKVLLKQPNIFKHLLNNNGQNAIELALATGNEKIVQSLLEENPHTKTSPKSPNSTENACTAQKDLSSPFIITTEEEALESLKLLISEAQKKGINLLTQLEASDAQGRTALMKASMHGHQSIVEYLLSEFPELDVNATDSNAMNALTLATSNGHESIVSILLTSTNIDVNHTNKLGMNALMIASQKGYSSIVEHLFSAFPTLDVHKTDSHAMNALTLAAEEGHDPIVYILLTQTDIDVNHTNILDMSALMIASKKRHLEVVHCLLKHSKQSISLEIQTVAGTALSLACEQGDLCITQALLLAKPHINHVNDYGLTPLMIASMHGHHNIVELLLTHPDIDLNFTNACKANALHLALNNKRENTALALLSAPNINPNIRGPEDLTPLIKACHQGKSKVAKTLLTEHAHSIDVNAQEEDGISALVAAVNKKSQNHTACIKALLKNKELNPNVAIADGRTALMIASISGYTDAIKLLLKDSRTLINLKSKQGNSALHQALHGANPIASAKLLINHPKIDLNSKNLRQDSVLMTAVCLYSSYELIDPLLSHPYCSVELNAQNILGYTALMLASEKGAIDIVERLLQEPSIDPKIQSQRGDTALMHSIQEAHYQISILLLSKDSSLATIENSENISPLELLCSKNSNDPKAIELMDLMINLLSSDKTSVNDGTLALENPDKKEDK